MSDLPIFPDEILTNICHKLLDLGYYKTRYINRLFYYEQNRYFKNKFIKLLMINFNFTKQTCIDFLNFIKRNNYFISGGIIPLLIENTPEQVLLKTEDIDIYNPVFSKKMFKEKQELMTYYINKLAFESELKEEFISNVATGYYNMNTISNANFNIFNLKLENSPIYFQLITTYFECNKIYNNGTYTDIDQKIWKENFNYLCFKEYNKEEYKNKTSEERRIIRQNINDHNRKLYDILNNEDNEIKPPYEFQEYMEFKYKKIFSEYEERYNQKEGYEENIFRKLMINNILKSFDINYCKNFFDGENFYCLDPDTIEKKYMIVTEKTFKNYHINKSKEWSNESYIKINNDILKSYVKFYNRIIKYTSIRNLVAFGNVNKKCIDNFMFIYNNNKNIIEYNQIFTNTSFYRVIINMYPKNPIRDKELQNFLMSNNINKYTNFNIVVINISEIIKKFNNKINFTIGEMNNLSNNDKDLLIEYIRPIVKMVYLQIPFIII